MTADMEQLRRAAQEAKRSNKERGDDGERYVAEQLQRLFPGCSVVSTAREGGSGDLRLEIEQNSETTSIQVEVKNHTNTVCRQLCDEFKQVVSAKLGIHGGILCSLESNIACHPDFTVAPSDNGEIDMVFLGHVKDEPQKLALAVRFLLARHRQGIAKRRGDEVNQETAAKVRRAMRRLQQAEAGLLKKLQGIGEDVAKLAGVRAETEAALGAVGTGCR
jgi:hypothetical protein